MAFGDSGGIYRKYSGTWHKNSSSFTSIASAIEFNGYIYWTNNTSLYRIILASIGDAMNPSAYQSFANSTAFHPMSVAFSNVLLL